jgi:hypothetical protein
MTDSLHLGLPYIAAAQAQKHITHNEALRALDALVMLGVLDRDLTAPPGSPAEGARYLVKATGTGAFAGKDGQVAHFRDGGWAFHAPRAGWIAYVADEDAILVHDGSAWRPLLGAMAALQNLSRLGLATSADATNPLSAVLNNALFAARTVANGGDGDLRHKLSKESASHTASLLLQDNFSGRAEIGLTGDDDLHLKVSSDGTTWRDGLVIAAATGKVSFPQGTIGLREKLAADRTYYVRTDGDDGHDGLSNTAGGAFATLQKAVDVIFGGLDLGGHNVTVQLADGTYTAGVVQGAPQVGAGLVTVQGNAANPENVIVSVTAAACFFVQNGAKMHVKDLELRTTTSGNGLRCAYFGYLTYANIRFGACVHPHVRAEDHGIVVCLGNCSITGSATSHWNTVGSAIIRCQTKTITLGGTITFSVGFADCQICGQAIVNGNTFSGSATGKRYRIDTNAVLYVGGAAATYLPGDVSGTTATGAQYA